MRAANSASPKYQYTNGQPSGSVTFTIPAGMPAGTTYELRVFRNNTYVRLATANPFAVQ